MPLFLQRLLALILCAALLITPAAAENEPVAYAYTLDFDMHAAAYPEADQELLTGVADLLNMLHISGVYATDGRGFDNTMSLILSDDGHTRTDLQVSGKPDIWWITSSLLGNETLGVNNAALLEFAMKAYAHLEMPLQYAALLANPYVHTSAFHWIAPEWEKTFKGTKSRTIKRKTLVNLAQFISDHAENDRTFYYWVLALGRDIGIDSLIFDALYFLPDWTKSAIDKNGIKITVKNGVETWMNGKTQLFTRTAGEDAESWQLDLPADSAGRYLSASFSRTGTDITFDLSVTAASPADVLHIAVTGTNLPQAIPFTGSSSLQISAGGILLPQPLELRFNAISDGQHFIIAQTDSATGEAMLTLSGRITPTDAPAVMHYAAKPALTECVNLLSINDASLADLVNRVARPLATGAWPLLVRIPASSFASLFSFLEKYDVLEMIINSFD